MACNASINLISDTLRKPRFEFIYQQLPELPWWDCIQLDAIARMVVALMRKPVQFQGFYHPIEDQADPNRGDKKTDDARSRVDAHGSNPLR